MPGQKISGAQYRNVPIWQEKHGKVGLIDSIKSLVAQGRLASSRCSVSCMLGVQRENWHMNNTCISEKRDSFVAPPFHSFYSFTYFLFFIFFFFAPQRLTESLEEAQVLSKVQSPIEERTASFVSNLLFIVVVKTTSPITS